MTQAMRGLSVRLDHEAWNSLHRAASTTGASRSQIVRAAVILFQAALQHEASAAYAALKLAEHPDGRFPRPPEIPLQIGTEAPA